MTCPESAIAPQFEPLEPRLLLSAWPALDWFKVDGTDISDSGGKYGGYKLVAPNRDVWVESMWSNTKDDNFGHGGITLSFPGYQYLSSLGISASSDFDYDFGSYGTTESLYRQKGDGIAASWGSTTASYILFEGDDTEWDGNDWSNDEEHTIRVRINTGSSSARIQANVRGTMTDANWQNAIRNPYGSYGDADSQQGWRVYPYYIYVDATGPYAPSGLDMVDSYDTGSSSSDEITSNTRPKFDWDAPSDRGYDSSHVAGVDEYYWAVTPKGSSTVLDDGWTSSTEDQIDDSRPNGDYTFHVWAIDNFGNWGSEATIDFTIDATDPNTPTGLTNPANPTDDFTPNVSWNAPTETGSGIWKYIIEFDDSDLGSGADVTCVSSNGDTDLDNGEFPQSLWEDSWQWRVKAVDVAGNDDGSWSDWKSIDLQSPHVTSIEWLDIDGNATSEVMNGQIAKIGVHAWKMNGQTVQVQIYEDDLLAGYHAGEGDELVATLNVTIGSNGYGEATWVSEWRIDGWGGSLGNPEFFARHAASDHDSSSLDVHQYIPVAFHDQENSMWCWAFATSHVLSSYGYTVLPWEIAADFDKAKSKGLYKYEVGDLHDYLEEYYDFGASDAWGTDTFNWSNSYIRDKSISLLDQGKPIWLTSFDLGHSIAVIGYTGAAANETVFYAESDEDDWLGNQIIEATWDAFFDFIDVTWNLLGDADMIYAKGDRAASGTSIAASVSVLPDDLRFHRVDNGTDRWLDMEWDGRDPYPGYKYVGHAAFASDGAYGQKPANTDSIVISPYVFNNEWYERDLQVVAKVVNVATGQVVGQESTSLRTFEGHSGGVQSGWVPDVSLSGITGVGEYRLWVVVRESQDGGQSYTPVDEVGYLFNVEVLAPEMAVFGSGVEIADGDDTPSMADDTDFGNADVSNGTVEKTFTIRNTGRAALNLTGNPVIGITGSHAGDFAVVAEPSTTIGAETGTTSFRVRFDPSGAGLRTATITISNNDENEDPYDFEIQGTGTTVPALTLDVSPGAFSEGAGNSAATGTVTRNGSTASALVVNLSSDDTGEARVPTSVTIPAGHASATFAVDAVDDSVLDGTQTATITASASGYVSADDTVDVLDDEHPNLAVVINPSMFSEGAGANAATGTVARTGSTASALVVSLSSSDTGEATVPATVTIQAGHTSATFQVNAVDDSILDGTQSVTITASAAGYDSDSDSISVTDDEMPSLSLAVLPNTFSETDGASAATGTVTRTGPTSSSLVVNLSSDDTSEATVPATVTIPAGQASTTFQVGAVDDSILDGTQSVTLTASAAGYSSGAAGVDVTDNEVPDTIPPTVLGVAMNAGDAQRSMVKAIAVQLSEDCSDGLTPDCLALRNVTTGTDVAAADMAVSYDAATNTATWTFPGLPGGTLPDGNYTAKLLGAAVADLAGNPLDGNGDGSGGDDHTFDLFRFFGDADGDRDVDFADLFKFRQTYQKVAPDPAYNPVFDGDADGDVDFADLFKYRQNYQNILPVGPEIDITDTSGDSTDKTIAFTDTPVGSTSLPQTFTLSNTGDQALNITNFAKGSANPTDLENLPLGPNQYWNGNDGSGGFTTGPAYFNNLYTIDPFSGWAFWGGWAYSNMTDTTTPGYTNQYSAIAGGGQDGSSNYGVAYQDPYTPTTPSVTFSQPTVVDGAYFTNTTYTYLILRDGDPNGFSKKFGGATGDDPDWFRVTVTGKNAGGQTTGSVDFYLADFRFADNAADYIVSDWTWADLSGLGEVAALEFTLASSDSGVWGINTPAYFALDSIAWAGNPSDFGVTVKDDTGAVVAGSSFSIPVATAYTVKVVFSPTAAGARAANITFDTNDPDDDEGSVTLCLTGTGIAQSGSLEFVPVGNPGNAADDTGYGAVAYSFDMGMFEVTAGQYTVFLNAVAKTDAYGLYSTQMDTAVDSWGCNIKRTGSSGSYSYSVASDWANRPVNYVSWGDAARFANWLTNGQPTGVQDLMTTEDGSYYLNGAISDTALLAVVRKSPEQCGRYYIPTEDEWYKAAYYNPATGTYYTYPTSNNLTPGYDMTEATNPGNNANYYGGTYPIDSPYYTTLAGEFELSDSPYGTFDQGGNVWEWNEAILDESTRGVRGGSFIHEDDGMLATYRIYNSPAVEIRSMGFRISEIIDLPAVLVLHNEDPDYSVPPFDDTLQAFGADGSVSLSLTGFNIGQTVGGNRAIAFSSFDNTVLVCENAGEKITKYDLDGDLVFALDRDCNAVNVSADGTVYALTSSGTIFGEGILKLASDGEVLAEAPIGGFDLAVDETNQGIFVVGSNITYISFDLTKQWSIDPIAWCAVSVDVCSDGSAWIAERLHSQVSGSQNRLLHVSASGTIIDIIDFSASPLCLRVDRSDDSVYVVSADNNLYKYDKDCNLVFAVSLGGPSWSVAIDSNKNVWVGTFSDVRKFSPDGNLLMVVDEFTNSDQMYVACP